ncbi:LuxR C-terminal-related transcriptional regulator [Chryseobacterium oryctis]|uniref:LuxR C-terminal-related transcriptional regulator n=1 Tax=Chryseobacterium oryctis TaxID=2952618 RepID=A0ABT3HK98_9FLAO|nr:LuxR C-terminal-related transcriptional regulator [Chryseobacterium oryctis]MCW3160220.1 LuxR C-terminal-related transcriptional regulator [Chryseobacterium oryctis]
MSTSKWSDLVLAQSSYVKNDTSEDSSLISSYFFLFDCFENKIIFSNSSFEVITGYKCADFTLDFLLSIIHPDDLDYFFECEKRGLEFTNKLSFNEHFKFILNYTYRIRISDGTYIGISQQCKGIEVNTRGHLTKTLVNHRVLPEYTTRQDSDYKIFDKTKNIFVDADNCYNLTKRELEVVHLVGEGLSSEQIADKLFLSKNTIITHRRNILNKTNSSSFLELLKKMRLDFTMG